MVTKLFINLEVQALTSLEDRYLMQNMDWLEEELGGYDDDYLVIDCPGALYYLCFPETELTFYFAGQIELYTHHPFLPTLVQNLTKMNIRVCAAYLIESQFMEDRYKFFRSVVLRLRSSNFTLTGIFISGVLSAMSAMVNLEIPWINIMSKMDLVTANTENESDPRNGIRQRKDIARYVLGGLNSLQISQ